MDEPEAGAGEAVVGPGERRFVGERRPATDAEARALASAVRLRILRLCLDEALTNKELAARLGRNPATVLHHVRTLVDTGFLVAESARRGARGAREVPYRATGKSWLMDGAGASGAARDAALAAFLEEVAAVGESHLESTRLGLRLGAADLAEFRERLHRLLDEYATRPADPGAERWSLYLGMHPEARGVVPGDDNR
ncbi:winged helix-turn-helix domain-containing protein [Modestobacter sp. VKM Ac-2977]|uniref:ArsR/SmtB family transcription factor n=1 Tax=Modestobacter sp. VKM Ac-2977 TaxID=3004131 RepID=UPI0022AA8E49|nr:winged helix-turn-helix domain-containing protein [Modestobacter sp. VKM Ac-2977]MCZ2821150.1 winged helix-turn-helix domain-containing protein [Modestobacter sp. VKM Ac-2977]